MKPVRSHSVDSIVGTRNQQIGATESGSFLSKRVRQQSQLRQCISQSDNISANGDASKIWKGRVALGDSIHERAEKPEKAPACIQKPAEFNSKKLFKIRQLTFKEEAIFNAQKMEGCICDKQVIIALKNFQLGAAGDIWNCLKSGAVFVCYRDTNPVGLLAMEKSSVCNIELFVNDPSSPDCMPLLIEKAVQQSKGWGYKGIIGLEGNSFANQWKILPEFDFLEYFSHGRSDTSGDPYDYALDPATSKKWCKLGGEFRLLAGISDGDKAELKLHWTPSPPIQMLLGWELIDDARDMRNDILDKEKLDSEDLEDKNTRAGEALLALEAIIEDIEKYNRTWTNGECFFLKRVCFGYYVDNKPVGLMTMRNEDPPCIYGIAVDPDSLNHLEILGKLVEQAVQFSQELEEGGTLQLHEDFWSEDSGLWAPKDEEGDFGPSERACRDLGFNWKNGLVILDPSKFPNKWKQDNEGKWSFNLSDSNTG